MAASEDSNGRGDGRGGYSRRNEPPRHHRVELTPTARILSGAEVTAALPLDDCVEAMAEVFAALTRGELHQPLRWATQPPGCAGDMSLMPAYRGGGRPLFALKSLCVFPGNPERGLDMHQGLVTLFDGATGEPRAILDATTITTIRTAAVSALATRLLAREDARTLAIIGAGRQAPLHLAGMLAVRDFERVRLFSRTRSSAERLARETAAGEVPIEVTESAEAALRDADVVVTLTGSRDPVLRRDWLPPGAHVNAVGASTLGSCELDTATVAACSLFAERRESVLEEARDFREALEASAIPGPEHILAELGEVVTGEHPGRTSAEELTVFRSLGLAVEDLAAAERAVANARRDGLGVEVEV